VRTTPNEQHPSVKFLKSLYQHCEEGFINLRFLPSAKNLFIQSLEIDSIPSILESQEKQNCYFGVATRRDGDGSKGGIAEIPSLWCDVDVAKGSPAYDHFKQIYKDFPLKPSILVESGGGYHLYWLLKEPASKKDVPRVEDLLKRISAHLGGDMVAAEAARILRVPGTWNMKYNPKRRIIIRHFNPEKQYNLDEFEILPPLPAEERAGRDQLHTPGWEQDLLKGVSKGERNISITRLAGRYLGKGLSREEILPILMDANARFAPPLALKEVEVILDSVIKTDSRNHSERSEKPREPDTHDGPPVLPTLGDIYDMDIQVEWVVDKLIPKQSVIVLHGKGGVGKTWLQLQMGSNVAEGIPFVGQLHVMQMPVYYIDFENSLATLHDRAIVLGKSGLRVWHVSNPIPPPRLDSKDDWERYKKLPLGLLIFDTLRASQLLDENSSRDMAMVMMRLKELRDMGFTVILIHHTPKGDERTYKGSTSIVDQCDHVLSLDRVHDIGSDLEIDDDDWKFPLRLGVRGKTRYEPFSIYLVFDPSKGFDVAPDPDDETLRTIHFLIVKFKKDHGSAPNQTSIVEMVKEHNINRKKVQRLLRKGEGQFWTVVTSPKTRAKLYEPIIETVIDPLSQPIYCGTKGQWSRTINPVTPRSTMMLPLENTSFTHCSEGMKTNGKMGRTHCSKGAEKNGTADKMKTSDYEVMDDGQLTY